MRIAINALGSILKDTGGKNYLINFIKNIKKIDNDNEYFLFLSHPKENIFELNGKDRFKVVYIKGSSASPYAKVFFEQFILPLYLIKYKIDVVYFPGNYISVFTNKPTLLFIQSVLDFYVSKDISIIKRLYRQLLLRISIRKAKKIIAPSIYAKDLIMQNFKIDSSKIDVVYHGIDRELFNNKISSEEFKKGIELLKKYGINKNYILYVAALWDYKNHEKLIIAFEKLVNQKEKDLMLVLIGSGLGTNKDYLDYIYNLPEKLGIKEEVIFIDNIELYELSLFYKMAQVFVFPSLCESFGFPVIEAMSCGIPVICSNSFALPEITGDAAILINSEYEAEILKAMDSVLSSDSLIEELKEKSVKRAELFSWEKSVSKTLNILNNLK